MSKKQVFMIILVLLGLAIRAQSTYISNMEDVGLTPGQVYDGSTGGNGFQSGHAFFPTAWDTSFGGFWSAGWVASALYDSSTAGAANQYGCIAYKGNGGSATYATGTTFGNLVIRFTDSLVGKTPLGIYVTNSTYAYKSMRNGDMFAKKFGDTTGTHCGCPQWSYPDWFKLTIRTYYGGYMTNDSAEVYLADYRFANSVQDYILKTWTWIDLSSFGSTDSLAFFLHSSDNGSFGMNTPAYFCVDDLTLKNAVGIEERNMESALQVFPNPASDAAEIKFSATTAGFVSLKITDIAGREMMEEHMRSFAGENKWRMDVSALPRGVYFVVLTAEGGMSSAKLIRQ